MKRILIYLLLLLQLAMPMVALAAPQVPPAPTQNIYVQDYAGVIDPQARSSMNAIAEDLARKTKAQIVVVTVKSLNGESLEDYSLTLLRKWGIGDKKLNNGVVLLVAVDDRKSRIEVGYGLEGALPDALTGRIQDDYMLPFFRQNQYSKGIQNAFNALIQVVSREYKVEVNTQPVIKPTKAQANQETELPTWAIVVLILGFFALIKIDQMFLGGTISKILLYFFYSRGGGGGGGGGSSSGGFGGGSGGGGGSSRNW